jgi:hypothetical protein
MFYDAVSLFQSQLTDGSQNGSILGTDKLTSSKLEMIVGPWYLDEDGNPTREIKARE